MVHTQGSKSMVRKKMKIPNGVCEHVEFMCGTHYLLTYSIHFFFFLIHNLNSLFIALNSL